MPNQSSRLSWRRTCNKDTFGGCLALWATHPGSCNPKDVLFGESAIIIISVLCKKPSRQCKVRNHERYPNNFKSKIDH
ncbi:hypothetical protein XELAEV_18005919mg [Xenopus laevis]|uniref:Uncharacterized protein n=1 Tax=Xenopus laevis TaxID=8355 RepID=A0A974DYJ0_XENLA|nr:hypothetical protein XELAEV_18005919mg [Xenopus laevis]